MLSNLAENQDAPIRRTFCDSRIDPAEISAFLGGQIGVLTCPSLERAASDSTGQRNEDSAAYIAIDQEKGIIVVADGMGGHSSGAQASAIAIEALAECMDDAIYGNLLLRSAIVNGFELANERVQALNCGAGTTLVVAEIGPDYIRPYHCGDSILLVTGQRGKVKLETISHSPVGLGIEAGLLDPDEAMHHEHRHLILNAIGLSEMRIEIGPPTPFGGRDTLLLASDGLTDNLSIPEIVNISRKGALGRVLQQLSAQAMARMLGVEGQPSKPDDLTIVAFRRRPG